jgi:hypothetical protein
VENREVAADVLVDANPAVHVLQPVLVGRDLQLHAEVADAVVLRHRTLDLQAQDAWVAAAMTLYLVFTQRRKLLGASGIRTISRSALVGLFALSSVIVLELLPYWGLLGNFTSPP